MRQLALGLSLLTCVQQLRPFALQQCQQMETEKAPGGYADMAGCSTSVTAQLLGMGGKTGATFKMPRRSGRSSCRGSNMQPPHTNCMRGFREKATTRGRW